MSKNEQIDQIEDDDVFTEEAEPVLTDNDKRDLLNERMVKALETLTKRADAGPVPQISVTKYKAVTPWNPTGARYKVRLKRPTYLNKSRFRDILLSQVEIEKLNALKPGTYRGGKWVVIEANSVADGDNAPSIQLFLPNRTVEQRLELAQAGRNLGELLDLILAEQNSPRLAS